MALNRKNGPRCFTQAPICSEESVRKSTQAIEKIWRPRRDLNPCYRRESNVSRRKLLKLRNTDGYQERFQ